MEKFNPETKPATRHEKKPEPDRRADLARKIGEKALEAAKRERNR
jgi:hypothetical protein